MAKIRMTLECQLFADKCLIQNATVLSLELPCYLFRKGHVCDCILISDAKF